MEISIVKIMNKDHKKIYDILHDFRKEENKNFEKSKAVFSRFKWIVEKHFFIEEKAIFNSYVIASKEENDDLMRILKEHRDILDMIDRAEELLMQEKRLEINDLSRLLESHSKFEDEVFYPRLDETLSEEQKQEIINRAKDIIVG